MNESRAAHRYAKALLAQAKESQALEAVAANIQDIQDLLKGNSDLGTFLGNPTLTSEQKLAGFEAVFPSLEPLVSLSFKTLLANKRAALLGAVAHSFTRLYKEEQGIATAVVTSAKALSESLQKQIQEKVASLIQKQVTITNIVDPSLMGGFILRVGDLQYNASVAAQLQQLEREFTNI
jgi:F-type H+-transporting ATPase subunit delta